mmetsp:Transcript_30682/g.94925  ORF Transcript_30682/g.94925 Transcript_30682/m.94925 type:complete len:943 (+) Transcript_30682:1843-4671(+)
MGYTTLREFALTLQQRFKHVFAAFVLDVCMEILRVRGDKSEQRKLLRELCVVSTRQCLTKSSLIHCKHVLHDLCEERKARAVIRQSFFLQSNLQVTWGISDMLFTSELILAQTTSQVFSDTTLSRLQREFLGRQHLCLTTAVTHELRFSLQQAGLSAACTSSKQRQHNFAVHYLEYALTSCPTSRRRRIALLSYLVEANLFRADTKDAQSSLRRIGRLRKCGTSEICGRQSWEVYLLWDEPVKGRLVPFCQDSRDLGQFAAEVALLKGHPACALRKLAPTVAAVETAVSRIGSTRGLHVLGALYKLRGRVQVSLSKNAEAAAFPVHASHEYECTFNRKSIFISEDMSRSSQSRHYQSYASPTDLQSDALRWYRHALECFKTTDDSYGSACAASSFAALKLNLLLLEHYLTFPVQKTPPLRDSTLKNGKSLRDVNLASRHALDIAAIIDEPLLLLEAYLNIAELLHMSDDPVGAIAHWWEARELLARLFVNNFFVPLATVADISTISKLRNIIERLVRFLAIVADKAMLDENLILFDILVMFERDATSDRSRALISDFQDNKNHQCMNVSSHIPLKSDGASYSELVNDAWLCWRFIVKVQADVACHCSGAIALSRVHHRNRNTLCELAGTMRRIRESYLTCVRPGVPTIFALHAAGALIVYVPELGWRHMLTFGRCTHGLKSDGASLVGAFTGVRRVAALRNGVEYRRSVLKQIAENVALPYQFFSTTLAALDRENSIATLVCSERAQILPWECMSDVTISRILCTASATCRLISSPKKMLGAAADSSLLNVTREAELLQGSRSTLSEIRSLIDFMIHDLSSSAFNNVRSCDSDQYPRDEKNARYAHPRSSVCTFWAVPLSALHAPPHALIQFRLDPAEIFFTPDAVFARLVALIYKRKQINDGASVARTLTAELALPIVHSSPAQFRGIEIGPWHFTRLGRL